jgi:hypothetical protein
MDDRLIRNGCFKKSLLEMMITVTTDDELTTSKHNIRTLSLNITACQ